MTEDFRGSTDGQTANEQAANEHDTGNSMNSQSHWTGDEAISRGVSPASQPAVDAGTALGGDPTRNEDDADQGVPESVVEGDGRNATGTTFSADPAGDKRL
ncbi:hypothetical protein [Deinococcus sp. SL84]|uniref:hypothetical protein n=1 Tax=Deinococcus sp. SL84 TaxID=2994663 RepID=UPI002276B33C|nr:hypothetical protein [Deinococcus sp. SL84]MCY1703012.1 hypothetical protein [Deinococcus sp. SL84]